jgi:hypothetical protein
MLRGSRWQALSPQQDARFSEWWLGRAMELLGLVAEPFDSLVALVSRLLWLHRNNRVFQGASLSVESLLQLVSILVCHEVGSEVGLV